MKKALSFPIFCNLAAALFLFAGASARASEAPDVREPPEAAGSDEAPAMPKKDVKTAETGKDGAPEKRPEDKADSAPRPVSLRDVIVTPRNERYDTTILRGKVLDQISRVDTVEGLFETEPGMDLNRQSLAGSESSRLTIRGFDESRYTILWGMRNLHGAGVYGGAYVDWTMLSLDDVEWVEVIRGASPVKFGNTLGGVVNIHPKVASFQLVNFVKATAGYYGTNNVQVGHSYGVDPVAWKIAAGAFRTDGYLRNSSVERYNISAEIKLKLPFQSELALGVRHTQNESGMTVYNRPDSPYYDRRFPESDAAQLGGPYLKFVNSQSGPLDWGDGSRWKDVRENFDISLTRKADGFEGSIQGWIQEQWRREHFYSISAPQYLVVSRHSKPEEGSGGFRADLENEFEFHGEHNLEYGVEGHYLGYGDIDVVKADPAYFQPWALPSDSAGKHNLSKRHGIYVQDTWEAIVGIKFDAGIRIDHFEAHGPEANAISIVKTGFSPGLGVELKPMKGAKIGLRYRRALRFPTLPEYYWWYSGYQPPDRDELTAECGDQVDFSAELSDPTLGGIVLRCYWYQVNHYIRTIFGYSPSRVVYNIDQVTLAGVEIEGKLKLPFGVSAFANYTGQYTRKYGDILDMSSELDDGLVELPQHKLNIGLKWKSEFDFEACVKGRFVSRRQRLMGSAAQPSCWLEDVDPFFDLGVDLSYTFWKSEKKKRGELFLSLSNLLGVPYEEQSGYPLPGFTVSGGWSMRF